MSNSDQLVRMAYASTATFKPFDTAGGIDGHVAQILETARRENKKTIWLVHYIMATDIFSNV